jgi:hypothetical protein
MVQFCNFLISCYILPIADKGKSKVCILAHSLFWGSCIGLTIELRRRVLGF